MVVGAGLAGLRAAETLRAEGFSGSVVLVAEEGELPYDRPPLSKQYLAGTWGRDRIALRPADKLDALGLDWRLGRRATACDLDDRVVHLDDGATLPFDGLVVATGAWPRTFAATADVEGTHVLRRRADADALAALLRPAGGDAPTGGGSGAGEPPTSRAALVVVGAGFIGTEVAATARQLGAGVTVVDPLATPLGRALGDAVGDVCAALHRANGVDVRTGVAAAALVTVGGARHPLGGLVDAPRATATGAGAERVAGVELTDGRVLPADAVLVAVGVAPDTGWLDGSGLLLDDGVVVDAALRAAPGVVAAGDLARWTDAATGDSVRIEHWTNASEQGVVAARTLLAGGDAAPYDPVPYVWSDQYDVKVQLIGRPAASDELRVIDGSLGARRFVAVYHRQGIVTGAVGFGRPRQLMAVRPLVQRRAPVAEAAALVGG